MTPLTSAQKMAARRVKLLALMSSLGFLGKSGEPSYSAFETALIDGYDEHKSVTVTIGDTLYIFGKDEDSEAKYCGFPSVRRMLTAMIAARAAGLTVAVVIRSDGADVPLADSAELVKG